MAGVPEHILKKVQRHIESKFPEMKGIAPTEEMLVLKSEPELYAKLGISLPRTRIQREVVVLHYTTSVTTDDGFRIKRNVRVVVDSAGKILKITTSK